MPEERPENDVSPESAGPEGSAGGAPDDTAAENAAGDAASRDSEAAGEAGDAASAALKAARDALASIQAEADAAMTGKAPEPATPAPAEDEGPSAQSLADEAIQAALAEAAAEQSGGGAQAGASGGGTAAVDVAAAAARALELPDFDLSSVQGAQHGLDLLADVQLDVRIELGRTRMLVEDVLRLNSGAVVELDKLAGDPLDVYVNDRLVARGEVLVLNDNFCIRINEIIDSIGQEAEAEVGR